MKAMLDQSTPPNVIQIHFLDVELPILPRRVEYWPAELQNALTRGTPLDELSDVMAGANRGRFAVELTEPQSTFHTFLCELICIEGLEVIFRFRRYSMSGRIGRLFDRETIFKQVVETVRRHFYPLETITLGSLDAPAASDRDERDQSPDMTTD